LWKNAAADVRKLLNDAKRIARVKSSLWNLQSPLAEAAKVGRGKRVLRGRDGLKKFNMLQTTQ